MSILGNYRVKRQESGLLCSSTCDLDECLVCSSSIHGTMGNVISCFESASTVHVMFAQSPCVYHVSSTSIYTTVSSYVYMDDVFINWACYFPHGFSLLVYGQ